MIMQEDIFEPIENIMEVPVPEVIVGGGVFDTQLEPDVPNTNEEIMVSNLLITMINEEWSMVSHYNDLIVALNQFGHPELAEQIVEIVNEDNVHIGNLQALLQTISPNAQCIQQGEQEVLIQPEVNNIVEDVQPKKYKFGLIANNYSLPRLCIGEVISEDTDTYNIKTALYTFVIDKKKFEECINKNGVIKQTDCVTFDFNTNEL